MTAQPIQEFLNSEEVLKGLQKSRNVIRSGGGTGKIVIELDFVQDRFRSGAVAAEISSGRMNAKQYTPE